MKPIYIIIIGIVLIGAVAWTYTSQYGISLGMRDPQDYSECVSSGGQIQNASVSPLAPIQRLCIYEGKSYSQNIFKPF